MRKSLIGKIACLVACVALAFSVVGCGADVDEHALAMEEALAALDAQDWDGAIAILKAECPSANVTTPEDKVCREYLSNAETRGLIDPFVFIEQIDSNISSPSVVLDSMLEMADTEGTGTGLTTLGTTGDGTDTLIGKVEAIESAIAVYTEDDAGVAIPKATLEATLTDDEKVQLAMESAMLITLTISEALAADLDPATPGIEAPITVAEILAADPSGGEFIAADLAGVDAAGLAAINDALQNIDVASAALTATYGASGNDIGVELDDVLADIDALDINGDFQPIDAADLAIFLNQL